VGAGVLAEPLIRFLFTEVWLPAVPYFQILCITGIMYPLHAYNLNILNVKGRSDLFLKLEIVKKSYVTLGVILAIPFGIMGLLWFQVLSTFIAFFINTHYSGKLIQYPLVEQIKNLLPVFALAGFMGMVCYFARQLVLNMFVPDWLQLVSITGLGAMIYFGIAHVIKFSPYVEFKQLALKF
ncbi:MAG TPA: polysaccharide biosynthesis C-terminal domain-containing protein, partial [Cyclobacteriaceae bacterium]|nr:polysaccharide biosynthesis C-terminal domain-containing protein [Cyclobacteriaceae bacterium]